MVMNHGLDGDAVVASLFDGPGPTMPDLPVMPIADCRLPDGGWIGNGCCVSCFWSCPLMSTFAVMRNQARG